MPSLWKAEAGVPGELLDSDWFSQEAKGRHGNMGQVGMITEHAATPSVEDPGPPRVREPLLKRRDSGCLV